MDNHFYTQYVRDNTRKNNLLDLFITDNANFVDFIEVEEISFSDHNLITIFNSYFSNPIKGTQQISEESSGFDFSKYNLNTANFENINDDFLNMNWDWVLNIPINDFPDMFRSVVNSTLEKNCSLNVKGKKTGKGPFHKKVHIINRKICKLRGKIKYSSKDSNSSIILSQRIDDLECKKKGFIF